MTDKFSTPAYKRSRWIYAMQCTFEYLISLIITGAFFSKLAKHIGMSDSLTGIILSISSLAFMFQILSIPLVGKLKSLKKITLIFNSLAQFIHVSVFLTPFFDVSQKTKEILIIIGIVLSYFSIYLVSGMLFKWGNSFVEPHKRGVFSAIKEMISLGCGAVYSLVVGFVFDAFESAGQIEKGFMLILIIGFSISIINLICLLLIKKDEPQNNKATNPKTKDIVENTIKNKNFRHVLILQLLWDVGRCATVGFLATYRTNDLLISVGIIEIMNVLGQIARLLVSQPFGKYSDRKSFAKGMKLGLGIAAAGYAIVVFTMPQTWFLIAIHGILNSIAFAGINANSFNVTYSYVKEEYIVQAMAIKNSIGGIAGFIAALLAGKFLAFYQQNSLFLFGIKIYGQQILALFSAIVIGLAAFYIHKVIEKQKVLHQ